ncbi:MAG: proprotein convertase P-domain-containing protein, partial [Flavobacteriales bacterium]|nr:proprotein convertase P-domain-containing protein [Flavobacteriales bacterium]
MKNQGLQNISRYIKLFGEVVFNNRKNFSLLFLSLLLISYSTPVFSQCANPEDWDGDGVPDYLDLDDDNDGILDVDEGLPEAALGNWGVVDATPQHDGGTGMGTVDGGACGGVSNPVNYTITDDAGGGNAKGIILLSDGGWAGDPSPAMVEDFNFAMVFDQSVNIRITATTEMFDGIPTGIYNYQNNKKDDIFVTTDGCDFDFFQGLGVGPIVALSGDGPGSAQVVYDDSEGIANRQTWYLDIYDVTTVNIEMFPGDWTSQYAIAVDPSTVCDALDTDGDNIPDYCDLDSDGDGCWDAIEGGGSFTNADLTNGAFTGAVDADGIPVILGGVGQAEGDSKDDGVQGAGCGPGCSLTPSHLTCANDGTGELDLTISTATAPYDILWNGAASNETSSATNINKAPVPAGTYEITVTDDDGVVFTCEATVIEPDPILITEDSYDDETCVDFCDGFINLTGSGGTYLDVPTSRTFTYDGSDGNVIINDPGMGGARTSEFDIDVTGMSVTNVDVTSLKQVCVDLTMPKSEKVDIYLIAPNGSEVGLFWAPGGAMGQVFDDVCFDVGASNIENSGSPRTGSWSAEEADFDEPTNPIIGAPTNGAWTLWIDNGEMNGVNLLDSWTMTFNDLVPAPTVPAFVWDGPAPIAGSTNDDISGLCDDTYTVTATDDLGCFTTFEREILTVPDVYSDIRIVPNKCFYAGTNSYDFY